MAGRETSDYWKERVRQVHVLNHGRLSLRELAARLQTEPWPSEDDKPPSPSTIGRIIGESKGILEGYQAAHWPGSFGTPDLPWEAGAAFFELTRFVTKESGATSARPSIRLMRAFWRVSLAAGEMSTGDRVILARTWMGQGGEEVEFGILTGEFNTSPGVRVSEDDLLSGKWLDTWEDMNGLMEPEQKAFIRRGTASLETLPEKPWRDRK